MKETGEKQAIRVIFITSALRKTRNGLHPVKSVTSEGKLSSVKLFVFMEKRKKQMTENKQEFKIMTADIQHLTQSAE